MDSKPSDAPSDPSQLTSLNIELQFGPPNAFERELVQQIQSPLLVFNRAGEILLVPILAHFKAIGYPLENSMVSYFSPLVGVYVYCGNDPLAVTVSIPLFEIQNNTVSCN